MTENDLLITNYHCASNRGDAAIFEGISAGLKQYVPGSQTILSEYPNSCTYINDVTSFEQRTTPFRLDRPGRTLGYLANLSNITGFSDRVNSWVENKLNLEPYNSADVVVGTGGHYLTEIYYPGKLGVLWELNYCKELGKPVVLCGQSFGPVESIHYRKLTKLVLNKLDAITVRDHHSKQNLESIGVKTDVHVTADMAFAMDLSSQKPLSRRRLESLPSLNGNPVFTISVRDWSHFDSGSMSQYLKAVADLCKLMVKEYGGSVYFLSTCTGFDSYHTDDRVTAHQVYDKLSDEIQENVQIVTGEYTPQELVVLFSDADFHVGTRMHSLILALLGETPVIGIEYQFKTSELMSMFELDEYVLSIEETTSRSLRELFKTAYYSADEIEAFIEKNLPQMRSRAKENGQIVANVIEDYS